jgi:hypothetical protein
MEYPQPQQATGADRPTPLRFLRRCMRERRRATVSERSLSTSVHVTATAPVCRVKKTGRVSGKTDRFTEWRFFSPVRGKKNRSVVLAARFGITGSRVFSPGNDF